MILRTYHLITGKRTDICSTSKLICIHKWNRYHYLWALRTATFPAVVNQILRHMLNKWMAHYIKNILNYYTSEEILVSCVCYVLQYLM